MGSTYRNDHLLPSVVFRLGTPWQESDHVLSQLRSSCRSAIWVLGGLIEQRLSHTDGTTREDRIKVLSLAKSKASWCILVARQKGKYVVLISVTSQDDVAQVRWVSTVIGKSSSLFVWIRRRERVRQLSRTHEHLAFIIGPVSDLNLYSSNGWIYCARKNLNTLPLRPRHEPHPQCATRQPILDSGRIEDCDKQSRPACTPQSLVE